MRFLETGKDQGTGVWLTRFPGAGDLDWGPGAGKGPVWGPSREAWHPAWRASPDCVISRLWLPPISAVVVEAQTTDMNSRAHDIGIAFLKTLPFSMKVFTSTPGFSF